MEQSGFLGCDVSKGYCDFLLINSLGEVLESSFTLEDTKTGRSQLKTLIKKWLEGGITALYCGVESTGGYENNWYRYLKTLSKDLPVKVARLNPRGVKAVGDAFLTRTVTDAVSAENIANYLIHFSAKVDYGLNRPPVPEFAEGRQHVNYINMSTKQKVQLSNQLEKLLYQYYSEVLVYCRHGIPGWLLRLLVKYPCASAVSRAGEQKVGIIFGIGPHRAKSILTKSLTSSQVVSKQVQHLISVTAKEILHKLELIDEERQYLQELYQNHKGVTLLCTIKGIGLNSAISILLEIEEIQRFDSAKKMASYFGVHPTYKESGDGIWGKHMSKKGRAEIRAMLYMASLSGIRHNPLLKTIYTRFRSKGMNHYQAMGVVMHKLLRIIFGILKNETPFDETIDLANVEKAQAKQKKLEELSADLAKENLKSKYRFQSTLEDAPISRRKYQKNKKALSVPIQNNLEKAGLPSA